LLTRQYVADEISAFEFERAFMAAHNSGALAREVSDDATEAFLEDVLYAVSNHSEDPDREWPDQLNDDEFRIAVARYLTDWEGGKYTAGSE
jgi:hypothetical protein